MYLLRRLIEKEIFPVFTVWHVLWMASDYHNLSVHGFYFLSSSNTREKAAARLGSERNIAHSCFLADYTSQICILHLCTESLISPLPPNNTLTKHIPWQCTILPNITYIVNIYSDIHCLSLFPKKGKKKEYIISLYTSFTPYCEKQLN